MNKIVCFYKLRYFEQCNTITICKYTNVKPLINVYFKQPCFIGDPDDKTLRKVEEEILIPQKMRDKAKNEKCIEEVKGNIHVFEKILLFIFEHIR